MSDLLIELSRWYNLLFVLPILIIFVYQVLHMLAGLNIGGLDLAFGDLGAIIANQLSSSKPASPLNRFFAFLNAGRIPSLIVIVTFLFFWGIVGFACNHWFIPLFGNFVLPAVVISSLTAFTLSSLITHLVSQAIDLIFPTPHADELRRADLVGTVAKVTSREVNTAFGITRTEDFPVRTTIYCQVDPEEESVKQGEKVVLWDYDPQTHFYKVQRLDGEGGRYRLSTLHPCLV
jgi:hypothetical protein